MNKLMGAALTLAAASALAVAPVVSASATEAASFTSHVEVVHWYKAGGTLDNIWPQNLTSITCGGIEQVDTYHINTVEQQAAYDHLIASATLNGPQDDAVLTPSDYGVVQLPDCIVIPPQPADLVKVTETHNLVCVEGFYYTTTTTITTPYVYDKETNSWLLGTPNAPVTNTTKRAATALECPVIAPVPPVAPPTTPPAHPTPTPKPVSTPSPTPTPTTATLTGKTTPSTTTQQENTAGTLAFTGSDSQKMKLELAGAVSALLSGIALAIFGRRRLN